MAIVQVRLFLCDYCAGTSVFVWLEAVNVSAHLRTFSVATVSLIVHRNFRQRRLYLVVMLCRYSLVNMKASRSSYTSHAHVHTEYVLGN